MLLLLLLPSVFLFTNIFNVSNAHSRHSPLLYWLIINSSLLRHNTQRRVGSIFRYETFKRKTISVKIKILNWRYRYTHALMCHSVIEEARRQFQKCSVFLLCWRKSSRRLCFCFRFQKNYLQECTLCLHQNDVVYNYILNLVRLLEMLQIFRYKSLVSGGGSIIDRGSSKDRRFGDQISNRILHINCPTSSDYSSM